MEQMIEYFAFIGLFVTALVVIIIVRELFRWVLRVLRGKTKIKCICKHEYEPDCAWYWKHGTEYEFKCRKCHKRITVKTATTDDKFAWIDN